jgi:hypothetical protein
MQMDEFKKRLRDEMFDSVIQARDTVPGFRNMDVLKRVDPENLMPVIHALGTFTDGKHIFDHLCLLQQILDCLPNS